MLGMPPGHPLARVPSLTCLPSRTRVRKGIDLSMIRKLSAVLVACASLALTGAAAAQSPGAESAVPIPPGQIDAAVRQLDELANGLLVRTGVPGMAVAVVHDDKVVYAKGFGVRK